MKILADTESHRTEPLREGWCRTSQFEIARNSAGIYEWRIDGVGIYVGKSKNLRSRFREYKNNLRKLINKLPYRKNNPDGFRNVHQALFKAYQNHTAIKFSILEFCHPDRLNVCEQATIKALREALVDSELEVFNADSRTTDRRAAK